MADTISTSRKHERATLRIPNMADPISRRREHERAAFSIPIPTPIFEEGESSFSNQPNSISEFTPDEQVGKYLRKARELKEEADRRSASSIHRILPRLKETNGLNWYEPQMVSIGPYFYKLRNKKLKMAEDYKNKCFGSFLARKGNQRDETDIYKSCLQFIGDHMVDIRKSYSEELEFTHDVFCEMMVVDACFILEIIGVFGDTMIPEISESLKALEWMVPYFHRDFLLLENQIPFPVLKGIYEITTREYGFRDSERNLMFTALQFFKLGMKRFDLDPVVYTSRNFSTSEPSHLLELVRRSLMPSATFLRRGRQSEVLVRTPFIHCISKLKLAGIKARSVKACSFLEVRFKKGVIEMPNIAIDDLMRCLLLNCLAFEQCYQIRGKYFTAYATFLDCLVNTKEDIEYLRERNVIDNYLTDDSELADFINRAGKDLVLKDDREFYLGKLFEDVDKLYQNRWKWKWASFEREYFDKPWLLLSAAGGILLVLATSFQAIMAFLAYKYKNC